MGRRLNDPEVADAYNKALDLEKDGDIEGAVAAYAALLLLDPADHGGARVRLAALKRGEAPAKAPEAYVEVLFDQNADWFEEVLVDQLGYGVPGLMRQQVDRLGLGPFVRMLDLGCGTGLAAEAMRNAVVEIVGIDISSRMIDVCEDKDIYDGLYCGEVEDFLAGNDEEPFDLISACDVLPYLGDLSPLFSGAAANLQQGGLLCFSSETLGAEGGGGAGYLISPHHRYLHTEAYIRDELERSGFELLDIQEINVRFEDGHPSPGHLVVARRS